MLDDEPQQEGLDPMVAKISALAPLERTKLWRGLAASRRPSERQHVANRVLAQQVEEFLAQIDFLRGEIEAVRKKLR